MQIKMSAQILLYGMEKKQSEVSKSSLVENR